MQTLDFHSRRSPVLATRGLVGASQPLAVAAGLEILAQGGNAADAAVATAAALNVTEPASTGLGGDCFALFYSAETGQVSALNGSGRAPAALTLERARQAAIDGQLPPNHPYTITVPGACAGWCDLIERHGRLSLTRILAPAIRLAEGGFPGRPANCSFLAVGHGRDLQYGFRRERADHPGAPSQSRASFSATRVWRVPCRVVAEGGKRAFYEGAIAEAIARTVQAAGGCLEISDLAAHHSSWESPISVTYRGVRIWECPPNGQGLTALLALNILEGFDLAGMDALSAARLHLEIEALRLAFADTRWYVADPAFNPVPVQELLSKDYAARRRALIDPGRATLDQAHGSPFTSSDTVYLSVVDGQGNACSFINSLYMGFGARIVPAGLGFALQNRGHNFSLEPGHPNVLAPGKRPYHTIIPALATQPRPGPSSSLSNRRGSFCLLRCDGRFYAAPGAYAGVQRSGR